MRRIASSFLVVVGLLGLISLFTTTTSPLAFAESPQETTCKGAGGKWEDGKCQNQASNGPSVQSVIQNVIDLLLFLVGIIAVIVIVVSGFRFVTSNGDPQQISKAKDSIIYAVIGIVVAVMAYAIVNFILDNV